MALEVRAKAALLWGAVAFLAFLVLVQGYALLAAPLLSLPRAVAAGLVVAGVAGAAAYALEHRVAAWTAERRRDGIDGE